MSEELERLFALAKSETRADQAACAVPLARLYAENHDRKILITLIHLYIGPLYEDSIHGSFTTEYKEAMRIVGKAAVQDLIEIMNGAGLAGLCQWVEVPPRAALALKTIAEDHDIPEAIEPLRQALNSDNDYLRRSAVEALGEISKRRDVLWLIDDIIALLTDTSLTRKQAAKTLEQLGDKRGLLFKKLIYDQDAVTVEEIGIGELVRIFAEYSEIVKRNDHTMEGRRIFKVEPEETGIFTRLCESWVEKRLDANELDKIAEHGELFAEYLAKQVRTERESKVIKALVILKRIVAKHKGTPAMVRELVEALPWNERYQKIAGLLVACGKDALEPLVGRLVDPNLREENLGILFDTFIRITLTLGSKEGPEAFATLIRNSDRNRVRFVFLAVDYLNDNPRIQIDSTTFLKHFRVIQDTVKNLPDVDEKQIIRLQEVCTTFYKKLMKRANKGKGTVTLGNGILSEGMPVTPKNGTFRAEARRVLHA